MFFHTKGWLNTLLFILIKFKNKKKGTRPTMGHKPSSWSKRFKTVFMRVRLLFLSDLVSTSPFSTQSIHLTGVNSMLTSSLGDGSALCWSWSCWSLIFRQSRYRTICPQWSEWSLSMPMTVVSLIVTAGIKTI